MLSDLAARGGVNQSISRNSVPNWVQQGRFFSKKIKLVKTLNCFDIYAYDTPSKHFAITISQFQEIQYRTGFNRVDFFQKNKVGQNA